MSKELEALQKDVSVLYDFARQYCDLIDLNQADTINCNKERLDNYFDQIKNADLSKAEGALVGIGLIEIKDMKNYRTWKDRIDTIKQALKKAQLLEEKLKRYDCLEDIEKLQNSYKKLPKKNLTKLMIIDIVKPFRDKYFLSDIDALEIARNHYDWKKCVSICNKDEEKYLLKE